VNLQRITEQKRVNASQPPLEDYRMNMEEFRARVRDIVNDARLTFQQRKHYLARPKMSWSIRS
jgi:hypothetical protein